VSTIKTDEVLEVVKRMMPALVDCHNKMLKAETVFDDRVTCALLVMYGAFMELVNRLPSTPEFTLEGQDTMNKLIDVLATALDTRNSDLAPTQPQGRA